MAPTEASSGRQWIDETSSEFSSHLFVTAALLCVDGGGWLCSQKEKEKDDTKTKPTCHIGS